MRWCADMLHNAVTVRVENQGNNIASQSHNGVQKFATYASRNIIKFKFNQRARDISEHHRNATVCTHCYVHIRFLFVILLHTFYS